MAKNALELIVDLAHGEEPVFECTCRAEDGEDAPWLAECLLHGSRDCPHGEPLHYHHDGCPACSFCECHGGEA